MIGITRLIIILLLSSFSLVAMSQDMSAMKKMMKTQMMAACNDKAFLSCIGISKNKCTSSTNKAMSSCEHLFPNDMNETAMEAHGECISNKILKFTGISTDKLDNCEPSSRPPEMDQAQMMEMMSSALKQHAQTIGTDDVNLPIYKNATVVSHMTAEMRTKMMGSQSLALLSLDSTDSISQIANYYRGKLKGFKEYKVEKDILFLKDDSKDFDIVKDFTKTFTVPNVYIGSIPGFGRRIDISYKK